MHIKSQTALFEDDCVISLPGSTVFNYQNACRYVPHCLPEEWAESTFHKLQQTLNWQQPTIRIAGKRVPIPRLQCWQGDQEHEYRYSGECFRAESWHPDILVIKRHIEKMSGQSFNSVLCNLYRDGQDSVSWHADDEPELGVAPWIASVSLGAERQFHIKLKSGYRGQCPEAHVLKLPLTHNSLLIMPPELQHWCVHQLPKTRRCHSPRINLTFRNILSPR